MLPFAILLAVGYMGYLLYEKWANDRALSSFQSVIHVNGIRGKTGVCRLIDANLRGAGYRVFTKTTGTDPVYIDTAGVRHRIRRWGPANIGEQLSMIRKARREGAQVLILECMAVDPVLQQVSQSRIVKGNLNVITNVRYDHMFAMGETLDEIAASLAGTIPENGMLFTADEACFDYFSSICARKNSQAVLCRPNETADSENEAIACAVGEHLGVPAEGFRERVRACQEDFGVSRFYQVGDVSFLNLFSVNDPQSTRLLLEQYGVRTEEAVFVYHHRPDRPDRLLLFLRHFFPFVPCKKIVVMGQGKSLAMRLLRKGNFAPVEAGKDWDTVFRTAGAPLVVGVGSIKGDAYRLIERLEGAGHE